MDTQKTALKAKKRKLETMETGKKYHERARKSTKIRKRKTWPRCRRQVLHKFIHVTAPEVLAQGAPAQRAHGVEEAERAEGVVMGAKKP